MLGIIVIRLEKSEKGIVAIDVPPAALDECNPSILKMRQRPLEKIRGRHKVRIEDGEKFASGEHETVLERTRLVAHPVGAAYVLINTLVDIGQALADPRIAL